MSPNPAARPETPARVWDLPTRLFHWALAAALVGSVASAKIGGDAMAWHFRFGYAIATLLAFRIVWGFVGGYWSRFSSFLPTPSRLARYLRDEPQRDEHFEIGHSPLGALSVFAMLIVLAVQVSTGLVADDEQGTNGPLAALVASATSRLATGWHKGAGQALVIGLVALHLGAIAWYRMRRGRNLVAPMLLGDKPMPAHLPRSHDSAATRLFAAILIGACAAAVALVVSLG